MMSTIHASGSAYVQYTKGAPDEILKRCTSYLEKGKVLPMTDAKREEILKANKEMADQALRVLAAAKRDWPEKPRRERARLSGAGSLLPGPDRHDRPGPSRGQARHCPVP